ncbi:DUF1501 domain-containing protein [Novosphingobium sp. Leaf2]|uniref:DUF1501 domain-containing protein n=1 Tax=Novosphingobium sp. Leaf2 TaxID=1735670 RepID=UPI0006FCEAEC|nr:DUF1501 domain-containing protein [Novosphingobium sp. Leaf2]KQM19662.1 hypothetical protein ASE49_05500 [Novosphingobium sp. Leaf2]
MDRRDLLKAAAAMAPMVIAGRAFAAPAASARLLVVFLRGAYDAANIVAPVGADFYHEARPTIGLAKPDPANPNAALPLEGDWGLHPALKDSIYPLWKARQIAFVPFAGTDDMTRSHFETQDTIELGQPIGGQRDFRSGFMARLSQALGSDQPIAFSDQVPLCFQGSTRQAIPNIALTGTLKSSIDPHSAKLIQAMYEGRDARLSQSVAQGFATRETVFKSLADEMTQASRGAVTAKGFELSARRIGTLMRDHYNLAFVDVGGWDTHVNQGGAQGYLAGRIGELGRGLAGFVEEIGPAAWRDTTVIVVSEFGRTFRENGDKGTDHGHGSVYWVMGGNVRGGRMAGPQVRLSAQKLNQNRDLPVLTDYRGLIGGVVQAQFGLGADRLANVFPGAPPVGLELV